MVLTDDPLCNGQTQTSATLLPASGLIHAVEALEDLWLILFSNARS
jgi:hypothetical protein